MYCQSCGKKVSKQASFCVTCGESLNTEPPETEPTTTEEPSKPSPGSTPDQSSPITIVALGVGWVLFISGYGQLVSGDIGLMGLLSMFSVFGSIPLLWFDARSAIRAGELSTDRPVYIVIAVYLLYIFTMPAYLVFRAYKRYK
jgi:hypothetical protein